MRPEAGTPSARSASIRRRARSGAQRRGSSANRPSTRMVRGSPRCRTWSGASGASPPRSPPTATAPSRSAIAAAIVRRPARSTRQAAMAASHATTKIFGGARDETAMPAPKATAVGARGVRFRLTGRSSRRRAASRPCARSSRGRARARRLARRDRRRHGCRRFGGRAPDRFPAGSSARSSWRG